MGSIRTMGVRSAVVFAVLLAFVLGSATAHAQQRTEIIVGSELDYPPYALVTDGQADGYSVDLMKAVCEVMDIKVTFRIAPWNEVLLALENGEIDALPLVAYSEERDKHLDFSVAHTVGNGIFFKRQDSPDVVAVDRLNGKSIAVMKSDASHEWLLRNGISENLALTKTIPEALRQLASGEHDYAFAPRLVGLLIAQDLKLNNIEVTGPSFNIHDRGYGFAVKSGDDALLAQLNEGLRIIKATGRYDEIYDRWFAVIDPRGVPTAVIVQYAVWVGVAMAVLSLLAMVWIATLRRIVAKQTAELRHAHDNLEVQVEERTRELRASEESLSNAQRIAHIGNWSLDLKTATLTWSDEIYQIFGADKASFGKNFNAFLDRVHPDDRAFVEKEYLASVAAKHPYDIEHRIVRADDGEVRWVRENCEHLYDDMAEVVASNGTVQDVTERKMMQETLLQNQKVASLGSLAAGMAHELNNPLAGIIQNAQNVARRLSPELTVNVETAKENGIDLDRLSAYMEQRQIPFLLDDMAKAADRAADIIKGMLRLDQTSDKTKTSVDLSPLIENAITMAGTDYDLKHTHGFHDIEIVREYARNLPPVLCLADEIERVVLAVVQNAAQAMSGQESTAMITVRTKLQNGQAQIEIEDNGPGLDQAALNRIFDPFYTTASPQRRGLGLSIAHSVICNTHRGQMKATSEPGHGLKITIDLPLKSKAAL
ncbi:transporter substrate-binding domain-containing protein [Pseudomonadota bacterium]